MTAAPGAWPSSRHLLGWWRDLADLGPQRLWVGRLPVHRIEALAAIRRRKPLDPLRRALLRFLSLSPASAPSGEESPWSALQMDPAFLGQLLRGLAAQGLVSEGIRGLGVGISQQGAPLTPNSYPLTPAWMLTPAGRQVLETGMVLEDGRERRTFTFLDRTATQQPPHFLPLAPTAVGTPAEAWPFDPAVLADCVRRDDAWKAHWGFPVEVEAILLPGGSDDTDPPDWQRVVLNRPEEVTALLVERSPAALTVFAVQPPAWALQRATPILELGQGWEEALGDLAAAPTGEQWKQAWQVWCQPRSLPPAEVEACRLEAGGHLLRVRAPHRLVERLKAARSDAVKQEAWLLAGAGRTRAAARISLNDE
jgi:hypothetical protein